MPDKRYILDGALLDYQTEGIELSVDFISQNIIAQ